MDVLNVQLNTPTLLIEMSKKNNSTCSQDASVLNMTEFLHQNVKTTLPNLVDNITFALNDSVSSSSCLLSISYPIETNMIGSAPTSTTPIIIGVVVGFIVLIAIVLLLILFLYKYMKKDDEILRLPESLQASFLYAEQSRQDDQHLSQKKIKENTPEYEFIYNLLTTNLGLIKGINIESAYAICNRTLLVSFVNYWQNMKSRWEDNRNMWVVKNWMNIDTTGMRSWVYSEYEKYVDLFEWNQGIGVPIVAAVHGTSVPVSEKICANGFAALSSLDAGFYGKGIYFTNSCAYAIPYFATKP
eukprot:TRINITY_DN13269_c0_g4_i1.p1 TRINITY_DN13269_c0_g4~~TRINITY_DN13269_c0_g4_i1.p1  ORF type:complete len:342 (+),score=71.95 TRINITY_DN13269_c0_g4_i1:128-1027(+)